MIPFIKCSWSHLVVLEKVTNKAAETFLRNENVYLGIPRIDSMQVVLYQGFNYDCTSDGGGKETSIPKYLSASGVLILTVFQQNPIILTFGSRVYRIVRESASH